MTKIFSSVTVYREHCFRYNLITSTPEERKMFKVLAFNYVIFDEAHMLKNMKTQRFENLMRVNVSSPGVFCKALMLAKLLFHRVLKRKFISGETSNTLDGYSAPKQLVGIDVFVNVCYAGNVRQ